MLAEARDALVEKLAELAEEHVTGQRLLEEDVDDMLGRSSTERTKREPLIMPVIVEV